MSDAPECPGRGKCHGPLKWCGACGDVGYVCDMQRRGETCYSHPVPPDWPAIRRAKREAEETIAKARVMLREGERALQAVRDDEIARRAFDEQDRVYLEELAARGAGERARDPSPCPSADATPSASAPTAAPSTLP